MHNAQPVYGRFPKFHRVLSAVIWKFDSKILGVTILSMKDGLTHYSLIWYYSRFPKFHRVFLCAETLAH